MKTVIVTGSAGLVGSECVRYYAKREFKVVGIDNDMRGKLFGADASISEHRQRLNEEIRDAGGLFSHLSIDIRHAEAIEEIFSGHGERVSAVIHTAAQPSHDWAARDPQTDFGINAVGTLNLLEATRKHCHKAAFVFTSTNKVYGDDPNWIPMNDEEKRFEPGPWWKDGFDEEKLSIDQSKHSLFGCSKLAADILVQEYGRYFGMNTVAFRCGCLTGPAHAGTKLHGFLSYLVKCALRDEPYTVIGYNGKQVRDNLHSADLVDAFDQYIRNPRPGEVYNMGGGRENSCSVREAISLVERITGKKMRIEYEPEPRIGDHKWWITDTRKFREHYPEWKVERGLEQIVREIVEAQG